MAHKTFDAAMQVRDVLHYAGFTVNRHDFVHAPLPLPSTEELWMTDILGVRLIEERTTGRMKAQTIMRDFMFPIPSLSLVKLGVWHYLDDFDFEEIIVSDLRYLLGLVPSELPFPH